MVGKTPVMMNRRWALSTPDSSAPIAMHGRYGMLIWVSTIASLNLAGSEA